MSDATPKNRGTLIALAILFIGPLAVAWTLYLTGIWRPGAGANHGDFIQPIISLPRTPQPTADKGATDGGYLYGKWTLVHLADKNCDEQCRAAVVKTRQIRLAMGREVDRIDRVLFSHEGPAPGFGAEQPDLLVVLPTGAAGEQIVAALLANGGDERIFLVDPLGNLILSYPLDGDPADIRDDLRKLLRLSRIG
ncbi:MAG: hypothetical protein OER80_09495 [Gammaproteobacteria bacterium]|nr:hypothetical protein [Gammaproteobacteria bacterium]MDH3768944.1 hypothetical protein [Gammaproteobacteria bacterium]